MIISERTAHSPGINMVGDDVVIIGELFKADGALPVLLDNLPLQKLTHLPWRSQLTISPWLMWVFNALHTGAYEPRWALNGFSATAKTRSVNWAVFIPAKPHGFLTLE